MINVTVWNEYYHERHDEETRAVYPEGIHAQIASFLASGDVRVRTATLEDEGCGLSQEVLDNTDVLLWWGHVKHQDVPDEVALRVQRAVLKGMGAIFLHSGHHSKPFRLLMGTSCDLSWREDNDMERLWVVDPGHPIAQGLGRYIEIPADETYAEPFGIPTPDELVFITWYEGGEVFRSGCCYKRGHGKVFYFQPGHETLPVYYQPDVQRALQNAVRWAAPGYRVGELSAPHIKKIGG